MPARLTFHPYLFLYLLLLYTWNAKGFYWACLLTSTATVTFVPGGNLDGRRHNGLDFDEDEVMQVGTPINGLEAALEAAATPLPAGLVTT